MRLVGAQSAYVGDFSVGVGWDVKMRSIPFIPTVAEISTGEASQVQGLEAVISYWTEGSRSAEEWFEEVLTSWGPAGFMVRRGEEFLGFVVYGPREYLPRVGRYPSFPLSEDAALLAYLAGDARTRRHLLVRSMRDLRLRGYAGVEAIASDIGLPRHVPTRFLLESGWKPAYRDLSAGCPYTLMRADFGSIAEVGERARALVGRVKLPTLRAPEPALAPMSVPAGAKASQNGGLEG